MSNAEQTDTRAEDLKAALEGVHSMLEGRYR